IFLDHSDSARGKNDHDREQRFEIPSLCFQGIKKLVASLALKFDVERFFFGERRIDKKTESAAGLKNRAVPRVLRQKRPRALPMWFHADARTNRVVEKLYFHAPYSRSSRSQSANDFHRFEIGCLFDFEMNRKKLSNHFDVRTGMPADFLRSEGALT